MSAGRRRRFRVASLDTTAADGSLDPGADVHRHLRVLRARAGDSVWLFDGRGREVRAEVTSLDADAVRVRVLEEVDNSVESALETCLVQAVPVRVARMETIVRQATELGVHRLVPLLAARSPQGKAAAGRRKLERWRRIADSAAEQCGRSRVPDIAETCRFDDLAWDELPSPVLIAEPGGHKLADAPDGSEPTASVSSPLRVKADGSGGPNAATVLVGPEGGWTADEVDAALAHGALPLRLGPRILRADSAGAVALAVVQYLWGDLG